MIIEDFEQIKNSLVDWEKFGGKTILITGANGFLPAYIVETLLLLNYNILQKNQCKIIALVRNEQHAKERFFKYLNDTNLEILIQDVSNKINIKKKIDYIIHAASLASPKYYSIDPIGVILPNILGTKNVLELAKKNNIESLLYFSSGEVYGEISRETIISENKYGYLDPTNIRSCYAESKRMGETICVGYWHQYNIPIKIIRPFHTYGPGMKLDDGRVFADFVKNIIYCENIEIKSNGNATRPFCYLADAAIAFFIVLLNGKNGEAYNVANPYQIVSIKKLATTLVNLFPEKKIKVVFSNHDKNYLRNPVMSHIPDITKVKSLGWNPCTTIEEGFNKTVRSYL